MILRLTVPLGLCSSSKPSVLLQLQGSPGLGPGPITLPLGHWALACYYGRLIQAKEEIVAMLSQLALCWALAQGVGRTFKAHETQTF